MVCPVKKWVLTRGQQPFPVLQVLVSLITQGVLCLLSYVSNWKNTWIIDTGASDYMCHNKDLFSTFKVLSKPSTVTLPNEKCVSVQMLGQSFSVMF